MHSGCAANARVEINGSYYGLYVAEENTNKRVLAEFFPNNTGGLWKAGIQPETQVTLQSQNLAKYAPPTLPDDVRCEAAQRYIEAYERITGRAFEPATDEPQARIRRSLRLV